MAGGHERAAWALISQKAQVSGLNKHLRFSCGHKFLAGAGRCKTYRIIQTTIWGLKTHLGVHHLKQLQNGLIMNAYDLISIMLIEMYQRTPKDPSALCQRVADLPTHPVIFASQVDLKDKDGLTPLMHGLLAVRSSMDSESAVRAVSVLAQHSEPGSLQRQEEGGWGPQQSKLYCKTPWNCNPPTFFIAWFPKHHPFSRGSS